MVVLVFIIIIIIKNCGTVCKSLMELRMIADWNFLNPNARDLKRSEIPSVWDSKLNNDEHNIERQRITLLCEELQL